MKYECAKFPCMLLKHLEIVLKVLELTDGIRTAKILKSVWIPVHNVTNCRADGLCLCINKTGSV